MSKTWDEENNGFLECLYHDQLNLKLFFCFCIQFRIHCHKSSIRLTFLFWSQSTLLCTCIQKVQVSTVWYDLYSLCKAEEALLVTGWGKLKFNTGETLHSGHFYISAGATILAAAAPLTCASWWHTRPWFLILSKGLDAGSTTLRLQIKEKKKS